jgi:hypothetical protein
VLTPSARALATSATSPRRPIICPTGSGMSVGNSSRSGLSPIWEDGITKLASGTWSSSMSVPSLPERLRIHASQRRA